MGQIADILQARGDLDGALHLQQERLPVAEQMGDIESMAHILFSMALIKLQKGIDSLETQQGVMAELSKAWELAYRLGRADFIGFIGMTYGNLLAQTGQHAEARRVLEEARKAFAKLQRHDHEQGVVKIMAKIPKGD
ncbi:MAG: hypothetical protein HQL96_02055 [Magnetococcales bacterium]|nr:hypothetical protein [Magnetococcales bacterium]